VDLDRVADELYGLPPDEFTRARDDAAREASDPAGKKAVKALRRPTVGAHAVNRLVRERPDDIDALLDLGERMRAAMAGGGAAVRDLTEERRRLVSALVDPGLPSALRDDVTSTLEAATADPDLGAAVRTGRLVKPLRYAGFGTLPDLGDALATPLPNTTGGKPVRTKAATQRKAADPRKASGAREAAPEPKPDLTAARQRVLDLAGVADDAQRRFDAAVRAAAEARTLLDRAEAERAEAHKAARAAHAEAERARRDLGRLERS
jgi:hypothetical protein